MEDGGPFEQVLAAAKANAGWAFERLYASLAPAVQAYIWVQGERDHEDLASEVFLAAFTRIGSFRGNEAQFLSWVFTIAHHRIIDARRARSRRPQSAGSDPSEPVIEGRRPSPSAEDVALPGVQFDGLRAVLDKLSPEQRDVIVMRVIADLPVEEVARTMGKREGAVRGLQFRALAALRRELATGAVTAAAPKTIAGAA